MITILNLKLGNILENTYINCIHFTIQIVVFHPRGDFYLINHDNYTRSKKSFGDITRAIGAFNLTPIFDLNSNNRFNVPANIKKFLFDYKHSRFLECNSTLANRDLIVDNVKYKQNLNKNLLVAPTLKYATDELSKRYMHYWLAGGTLLGWYRDCGLIPHTKDLDVAMWFHEYNLNISNHFKGNKIVRSIITHGIVSIYHFIRIYFDYKKYFIYNSYVFMNIFEVNDLWLRR